MRICIGSDGHGVGVVPQRLADLVAAGEAMRCETQEKYSWNNEANRAAWDRAIAAIRGKGGGK